MDKLKTYKLIDKISTIAIATYALLSGYTIILIMLILVNNISISKKPKKGR